MLNMQTQLVFANLPKSTLKLFVPDQFLLFAAQVCAVVALLLWLIITEYYTREKCLYLIIIDSRSGTGSPANCNSLQSKTFKAPIFLQTYLFNNS